EREIQKNKYINIHAPTEDKSIEEKEEYYEDLDKEYSRIPKYDIKIILGDANAKIGKEDRYRPTIGRHSKHDKTNGNGEKLIEFAMEKNMVIACTTFQRKEIYKGTWISPNREKINQIDHVVIEKQHAQSITNIISSRGADANTDHFLVR